MYRMIAINIIAAVALVGHGANATLISQIDKIQLPPDAYTGVGDRYRLTITGPINSTVEVEMESADIQGCNLCNAVVKWGTAINDDPTMSAFLTATFDIWDGVSVVPLGGGHFRADYDPAVLLTANQVGIHFTTTAAVFPVALPTNPFFSDLSVSVSIVRSAMLTVAEPDAGLLFGTGLLGLWLVRRGSARLLPTPLQ